jgi:hypothetical protein
MTFVPLQRRSAVGHLVDGRPSHVVAANYAEVKAFIDSGGLRAVLVTEPPAHRTLAGRSNRPREGLGFDITKLVRHGWHEGLSEARSRCASGLRREGFGQCVHHRQALQAQSSPAVLCERTSQLSSGSNMNFTPPSRARRASRTSHHQARQAQRQVEIVGAGLDEEVQRPRRVRAESFFG